MRRSVFAAALMAAATLVGGIAAPAVMSANKGILSPRVPSPVPVIKRKLRVNRTAWGWPRSKGEPGSRVDHRAARRKAKHRAKQRRRTAR